MHTMPPRENGRGDFGQFPPKASRAVTTWPGDSWMRGGGSTWLTGTYDPQLNTLYWGIGNPGPDLSGETPQGR